MPPAPNALQVKAGAMGGTRKAKAAAKKQQSQKGARQAQVNKARGSAPGGVAAAALVGATGKKGS